MQADHQHVETREENRIPDVLARAGGVLAAAVGLVVLVGWVLGLPPLSGPEPRWIPMAPSSALLFLLFGAAIFASAGAPISRPVQRTAMVIGSVGTLAALLLFFLSWQGIHPDAEHFGMAIAESATGIQIGHASPLTALGFALAGLSFLASLGSSPARPWHAAAGFCFAGVLVCASVVFLLGCLFGTPLLYGGQFIPPASTTCLAFASLGTALLALSGTRYRAEKTLRETREHLEIRVQERTAELERANRALRTQIAERQAAEEAVKHERQRLYDVLETLPVYVVLLTADHRVPFANRFFRERFGESEGRRCYEYLFHRDAPCAICESYTVLKTGAPHQWEWTGPDGRNYDIFDFPFTDEDGAAGILEMGIDITERKHAREALQKAHDELERRVAERTEALTRANEKLRTEITERKQAEDALRQSEARFRAIASHTPDHILIQDRDLRYSFVVNPQLGRTEAGMIGKTDWDILGKEDAEKLTAIKRKVLETGESVQLVTSLQNSKGETEFFDGAYIPKFDSTGKADGLIGYFRNVTERKRAEDALRNRENLLLKIFDLLPLGLWIADKEGKLLRGNPAGVKIWGAEPKVGLSQLGIFKARRLPSGEEVTPDDWALAHTIRDKVTIVDELLEIDAFDGKKKTILNYTAPVLDAQGEVQGAIVVNQDITERQRAEDGLRNYSKRLRELSQRLIEVEDGVRRNINRELHDRVGASLSALNLNLSILGSQLTQESLRAVGARLQDAQKLLEETTTHVRDLMADLHPPALDDYGLYAALRTYAGTLGARIAVPINVHGEPFEPRLPPAAETALFRAAQGALVNAVTHAHAKRIEILLAASPDRVALTIADDGVGFDLAQAAQAHASWGLAIMRERSEAVGARLTVESAPGKGTRVCVEIAREKR